MTAPSRPRAHDDTLRFVACVGDGLDDALALATRDAPLPARDLPDPRATEYVLARIRHGRITAVWRTRSEVVGPVRDRAGRFLVAIERAVSGGALNVGDALVSVEGDDTLTLRPLAMLPSPPGGLACLADGTCVVWPRVCLSDAQITLFDGAHSTHVATPVEGCIHTVHGASRDDLLASISEGARARIAHGNRSRWTFAPHDLGVLVTALYARDAHTAWAASVVPDRLLRATDGVWHVWNDALPSPCHAIVDDGRGLLLALDGVGIVRVADRALRDVLGVEAHALHGGAAGVLLATSPTALTALRDDRVESTLPIADLARSLGDTEALYRTARIDSDRRAWSAVYSLDRPRLPLYERFARIVGASFDDAVFLASRRAERDGRWDLATCEWILGHVEDGAIRAVRTTATEVCDLARSPDGTVWAAASTREGLWRLDPRGAWVETRFPVPHPRGVCAPADDCVVAWGGLRDAQSFWRFDGRTVHPMPAPPMHVVAMHGAAADLLVAVGDGGLVARWDGDAWHPSALPTSDVRDRVGDVGARSETRLVTDEHGWAETRDGVTLRRLDGDDLREALRHTRPHWWP